MPSIKLEASTTQQNPHQPASIVWCVNCPEYWVLVTVWMPRTFLRGNKSAQSVWKTTARRNSEICLAGDECLWHCFFWLPKGRKTSKPIHSQVRWRHLSMIQLDICHSETMKRSGGPHSSMAYLRARKISMVRPKGRQHSDYFEIKDVATAWDE